MSKDPKRSLGVPFLDADGTVIGEVFVDEVEANGDVLVTVHIRPGCEDAVLKRLRGGDAVSMAFDLSRDEKDETK